MAMRFVAWLALSAEVRPASGVEGCVHRIELAVEFGSEVELCHFEVFGGGFKGDGS